MYFVVYLSCMDCETFATTTSNNMNYAPSGKQSFLDEKVRSICMLRLLMLLSNEQEGEMLKLSLNRIHKRILRL